MSEKENWTADRDELDHLLADVKSLDPRAYALGQANVRARDQRLNWLRSLAKNRDSQGMDQTQVAALMGTSQSAVARLEGGLTDPKLSTLQRYANAIGYELQVTVNVRKEYTVSITRDELEDKFLAASKAFSNPSVRAHKAKKFYAYSIDLPDPAEGYVGVEMSPGNVKVTGSVARGSDVIDAIGVIDEVIGKVTKVSEDSQIKFDMQIDVFGAEGIQPDTMP